MNQQINLYLPEFRKEKDWLSVPAMLVICGAFVVLLAITTGVKYLGTYGIEKDIATRQGELNAAREATNALVDSYGVQTEDPRLAAEIQQLEQNLVGKRTLLEFLDGRYIGNVDGFSEYLADLARFHVSGLSLDSIDLREGGRDVTLRGEVSQAENVPLYLQNLSNGESYEGKVFGALRLNEINSDNSLETRMIFNVATAGGGR